MPSTDEQPEANQDPRNFRTTHWSMVLQAAGTRSEAGVEALETLCRTYWHPLYAFIRRNGHPVEEARDLTQAFFARLLEKNALHTIDRQRGKFRTFLLCSLKNFLTNEWDKRTAQKRGGGRPVFSIDDDTSEHRYQTEPVDTLTPDKLFERRWAQTVMETVLGRLRGEFASEGKEPRFEELKTFLLLDPDGPSQAEVGRRLNLSEQAVKSAVHRMRQRYRDIFRDEIANTVADPAEIEDEIRHLLTALSLD